MVARTQPVSPPPPTGKRTSLRFDTSEPLSLPAQPRERTLLTTQDVANLLGWSENRVRTAAKAGTLPAHYSGNRPTFYRVEIERWAHGELYGSGLPQVGDSGEEIERKLGAYESTVEGRLARIEARIEKLLDLAEKQGERQ